MIEAKVSFFTIVELKIKLLRYNNSDISFCPTQQYEFCVDKIIMKINSNGISINNETISPHLSIEVDGYSEISFEVYISPNISNGVVKPKVAQHWLSFGQKTINPDFRSNPSLNITADIKVQCLTGYREPNCTHIDLCQILPSKFCRNNGSCFQEEDTDQIKCHCSDGYKGEQCLELKDPCLQNICSKNSKCIAEPQTALQYRCKCNDDYEGSYCENLKNPCQQHSCSNNSKCIPKWKEISQYECRCHPGYTGKLCSEDIDRCAQNESLCIDFINATCISANKRHYCYCEGACQKRGIAGTTVPQKKALPFKLPFSEFTSCLIVVILGVIVLILIIVLVLVKVGSEHQKVPMSKANVDSLEFGSNSKIFEKIDNRGSMNLLYGGHDFQSVGHNLPPTNTNGVSTFGRL